MSFFTKIKQWFIGSGFVAVLQTAVRNIFARVAATGVELLTEQAKIAVGEAEASGLSSNEKKQMVLNKLEQIAITEGINAGLSVLNLIIETVVNAQKK